MYPNSHFTRIPASCGHRGTVPASSPHQHTLGCEWQRLYGPLGVLHKDTVGPRAWFSLADCGMGVRVCVSVCVLREYGRGGCGRNLWTCQLFSYLRCMYSFKDVANVLQDRNKDVKMKTCVLDLSNSQCLLPPTGYCVPMLKIFLQTETLFVLSRVNCTMNYATVIVCVFLWRKHVLISQCGPAGLKGRS